MTTWRPSSTTGTSPGQGRRAGWACGPTTSGGWPSGTGGHTSPTGPWPSSPSGRGHLHSQRGPLYQFGCRTIFSPRYYGPLADSTLHTDNPCLTRGNIHNQDKLEEKSFYPEYYTIHSYSKEHLHRQSISENQSRKTSKDLMLHFWYPFILIESSYFI